MKSILIGNGMSSMVDGNFRYQSLLDKIRKESEVSSDLDSIFDKLDSSDFELILSKLDDTISVLEVLGEVKLSKKIEQIRNECREALILAVSMVCPQLQNQTLLDTVAVNKEITKYEQIFTTNYDVLLYWCCKDESNWTIDDLFRRNFYPQAATLKPKIYYLHGAMHLFHSGASTIKLKADEDRGIEGTLVQKIKTRIQSGEYPIFISESTSDKKMIKIRENHYLNYCFERFSRLEGELDIFGHSLTEGVDDHLIDAISKSKLKVINIYSYKHNQDSTSGDILRARIKSVFKGKLNVFDSSSHPLNEAWCIFETIKD